ncbi:MAG: hypothetical protein ACFFFC_06775 [Candidatus Thorarchaeota archaeon]
MEIVFKCPECSGETNIEISEKEAAKIRRVILSEGRAPLFIVRCENEHELVVTFYNLRTGEGIGVRDVVIAYRIAEKSPSKKKARKRK